MSTKNPTISELIAAVTAVAPALSVDQARKAIREHNIRSLTKASLIATTHYVGKDAEELALLLGDPAEAPVATTPAAPMVQPEKVKAEKVKAEKVKAEKVKAEKPVATKKISAKGTTPRKTTTVVTPGPRGFRFGEVWTKSVKAGQGVAILPANRYKLIKHAEMYGIPANKDTDAATLAKQIAEAISAPKAEPKVKSASK